MTVSLYTKPGLDDVRAAQPQVAQEQNRGDAIHLRERVGAVAVFADGGGAEQPVIFVMLERARRHAAELCKRANVHRLKIHTIHRLLADLARGARGVFLRHIRIARFCGAGGGHRVRHRHGARIQSCRLSGAPQADGLFRPLKCIKL